MRERKRPQCQAGRHLAQPKDPHAASVRPRSSRLHFRTSPGDVTQPYGSGTELNTHSVPKTQSSITGNGLNKRFVVPSTMRSMVSRPSGIASPIRLSPTASVLDQGRPRPGSGDEPLQTVRMAGQGRRVVDGSGCTGSHSPSSWKRLQVPATRQFSASGPPTQAHNAPRQRNAQKLLARR